MPLLAAGLTRAASGSMRDTLLWLGAVSYAAYNYAYCMLGAALNAFFLVYVAAFVIAVITVRRGLVPSPGEVPTWATLAVATTIVTVLLLREIRGNDGSGDCHDRAAERH